MAGSLIVDKLNGVDISVSPPATRAYANSLLAEYVVSGSAVTSVDFSGLDINTHKSYRVEIEWVTVGTPNLNCFVNNDTVATNYYTQQYGGSAAVYTGARGNVPNICHSNGTNISILCNAVIGVAGGKVCMNSQYSSQADASITGNSAVVTKTSTVVNVTQLTFTSTVAGGIGVGSKIRIYRGDV